MSDNQIFNFLDGLSKATEALSNIMSSDPSAEPEDEKTVILTADKLREIRWMTERQIDAIYKHGKKPVKIDETPESYRELRWMTEGQLECLFGRRERN